MPKKKEIHKLLKEYIQTIFTFREILSEITKLTAAKKKRRVVCLAPRRHTTDGFQRISRYKMIYLLAFKGCEQLKDSTSLLSI